MKGVIVFVKNPELGKVKTRLAQTLGDKEALSIYKKLLEYTRSVLLELNEAERFVFYSSFIDEEDEWSATEFQKYLQKGSDLGHRMSSAFETILKRCEQVLIIGSDCAQLTSDHLDQAFAFLDSHDMVIGPSQDGGYYLLGMNHHYPFLFENIVWSSETVFQETVGKAIEHNLKYVELEVLSDIDNEEDWNRYGL